MKLSILAIAIVAASTSASVHAAGHVKDNGVSFGGFSRVDYNAGDSSELSTFFEMGVSSSAEVHGITYSGNALLKGGSNASDDNVSIGDVRFGMKGGFGALTFGTVGNACDALVVGGFPDQVANISQGGCNNTSQQTIQYIREAGAVTFGASHNVNVDENSVAVKGKFGNTTASLGYVDNDGTSNVVLGLAGSFGPLALGLRANDADGSDTNVGVHGTYTSGANKFTLGTGENGGSTTSIAQWVRDLGGKAHVAVQIVDPEGGDVYPTLRLQKGF